LLTAEFDIWSKRAGLGMPGDRTVVAKTLRSWQGNEDLAVVRDEPALAKLPADERRAWQTLWENVATLAARDPAAKFDQARTHVARTEWEKAARCYAEGMAIEPTDDSDLWFEYAAAQLLAGDRSGYRRTCAQMLARMQPAGSIRSYLVARAYSLAPDSTNDHWLLLAKTSKELDAHRNEFWSLTVQGAMRVRANQGQDAVRFLDLSLAADAHPGRAVLNWLWLALAYERLGSPLEARRWLAKARNWLDQQDGRMPRDTPEMGLHRHNWLEAHVLLKEAEARLPQAR
jgi:hypothetical protein